MAVTWDRATGRRADTRTILVLGVLLAAIAGGLAAVQPMLVVGLVGSILALFLAFTLPESILLGAFMFITLSGFRPFPAVLGFHIQAQYFLLLPMLARSLVTARVISPELTARWRPLVRAAVVIVGASVVAFGQDLSKPGFVTNVGNYTAWLLAFVFLVVLVRLAWARGTDFAQTLYTYLLDILGVFSAFTLVTSLAHLRSLSDASTARLSFSDLDPNQTGIVVVVGILLAVAPLATGHGRLRHLIWLPFLIPLLILTGSRDSLAALCIGLLIPMLQGRNGRSLAWYVWGLVGAVAAVLILTTADQSLIPASLKRAHFYPEIAPYQTLLGIHLPDSLAERVYIQASALHQFLQHPLLGIGFHQDLTIPESTSSAVWWGPVINIPVAHSAYLTVAAQQGILGLAAFLLLLFTAVRVTGRAVRGTDPKSSDFGTAIGIRATTFALLFTTYNLDSLYTDFKTLSLFFWLLVVATLLLNRRSKSAKPAAPVPAADGTKRREPSLLGRIPQPGPALFVRAPAPALASPPASALPAYAAPPVPLVSAPPQRQPAAASRINRFRLVTNAVTSVAAYVIYLPVTLLVNAYAVHKIGLAEFGVWATLTTLLGFSDLLDLGVTAPLVKYVAESRTRSAHAEVNALLVTGMMIYLVIGLAFAGIMAVLSNWILVHLFHVPSGDSATRLLFFTIVIGCSLSLTFSILQSLLLGLQRAGLVSRLTLAYNLLGAGGTLLVLYLGLGVNGLVMVWAGVTGLGIAGNWIAAKRLFPALSLNPFLFTRARLRQILRFSMKVQGSTLAAFLNDTLDRLLISYALGPALLGSYSLASRGAQAIRGISFSVVSGLLPAAADMHAMGQSERLHALYIRATRYLAILDLGLVLCVGTLARPLVHAWLGAGHDRVALSLIVILSAFTIALPVQATSEFLNGLGRPDIRLRADLTLLPIHLILAVVLIWRFGYFGTIVGTSMVYGLNRAYLLWAGTRATGVPFRQLLRQALLPPATAGLLATAVGVLIQASGAPFTIPVLIGELTAFAAVYLGYLAVFSLDSYERSLITSSVAPLLRRWRQAPESS